MWGYRRMHPHVRAVIDETGIQDPVAAVRQKARSVLLGFQTVFSDPGPVNVEALASFRGLASSAEHPHHSKDSEIAPDGSGRVVLRVNRDRPVTRQRFSICHEVGHTLFPEYRLSVKCRKAIDVDWADPNDLLEYLCDVAASEFLFPWEPFLARVAGMSLSGSAVIGLAKDHGASRDSTIRRLVELYGRPLAAVFLSWKHKPVEVRQHAADRNQQPMFADMGLPSPDRKLRVDYAIINDSFASRCAGRIPANKSVPFDGPLRAASINQEPADGNMFLDLATFSGHFNVHAVSVYTPPERVTPEGYGSMAMLLH